MEFEIKGEWLYLCKSDVWTNRSTYDLHNGLVYFLLNAALEDIVWSRAEHLRELLYIYVKIFCS